MITLFSDVRMRQFIVKTWELAETLKFLLTLSPQTMTWVQVLYQKFMYRNILSPLVLKIKTCQSIYAHTLTQAHTQIVCVCICALTLKPKFNGENTRIHKWSKLQSYGICSPHKHLTTSAKCGLPPVARSCILPL